jgi:cysteine desulfurase
MTATHGIYFDNAATTRPDPRVIEAVHAVWREDWGNPASGHQWGQRAQRHLNGARRVLAGSFGRRPGNVVFTSGATEANNLALGGVMARAADGQALVVSAIEHPAVAEVADAIEAQGRCPVARVGVDGQGRLRLEELDTLLEVGNVKLVSVMAVNNEVGVVQDLRAIAERVHGAGALLHVDAVQAVGKLPRADYAESADLLSISAHKIHGLAGSGALLLPRRLQLEPMLHGGGQQRGRRPGTESVGAAVGLARAVELALSSRGEDAPRLQKLRDRLAAKLAELPTVRVTAAAAPRAPHIVHLTLAGLEAEPLQIRLDRLGIATSVGSACSTGALNASPVLEAMGVGPDRLHGALRISFSRESSAAEVDRFLDLFPRELEALRAATR